MQTDCQPKDTPLSTRHLEGALPSLNQAPQFLPPTDEQWQRLEGIEAVRRLCEQFGYARVGTWVKNLAAMAGQDMERPADRCLADGAALINSVCVQCGRDNS